VAAHTAELRIGADEPAARGHFPGNPIVPGAVLLREVFRILARDGKAMCCDIRAARFFHPVRPGDSLTVRWDAGEDSEIAFTCSSGTGASVVLSGKVRLRSG
jgi:3-hydroxyacyl-[acyl-carrier-protein] dehydratase